MQNSIISSKLFKKANLVEFSFHKSNGNHNINDQFKGGGGGASPFSYFVGKVASFFVGAGGGGRVVWRQNMNICKNPSNYTEKEGGIDGC